MYNLIRACCFLFFLAGVTKANSSNGIFNVLEYGAVADGKTDSTKAIHKAWDEACAVAGEPKIVIPGGSYLVGPLMFKGPCKGDKMVMQLQGHLLAVTNLNAYSQNWIDFQYVNGLTIFGGGKLDGQGASAWPHNQCRKQWDCKLLPISLVLSFVNNAKITDITSLNSKQFHMNIFSSQNIELDHITIIAPGDSPNTDGIHMGGGTNNITITNSNIGTGDDCISIGPDTRNVNISGVSCGPGHGISVGSLGKNPNEGDVLSLNVQHCTITGTMNGVRIKSWQSSPAATTAAHFVFDDIIMNDVSNPIIIDQKYCPYASCPSNSPSKVKISDVKFRNIRGTSATPVAVNIVCSDSVPCEGVELSDINLEYKGAQAAETNATCLNAKVTTSGIMKPPKCA